MAERTKFAAPGFAGGDDGGLGDVRINDVPINHRAQHLIKKGDRVLISTPGGGGYGPPSERPAPQVDLDHALGYTPRPTQ